MKVNANIHIVGKLIKLIPYKRRHVAKYHEWMQSKELQELTASEPLTLKEEYAMQRIWHEDENKCIFLIVCLDKYNKNQDEIVSLVGDTNLLIRSDLETGEKIAEAEIMIAKPEDRSKGYGNEAILLMLKYGCENLNIERFEAKISTNNVKSRRLFKKLQFQQIGEVNIFGEITFNRPVTAEWRKWLNGQSSSTIELISVYQC